MSDLGYTIIRSACYPVYWITSRRTILHADRLPRDGAYILASNHLSPYDVPALIGAISRRLDFCSIVEMRRNRVVEAFFRTMNCEFVDRSKPDAATTRKLARRLERGRVVAMFPEGGIRAEAKSMIHGGPFKPGVVKLAQLARVPIIPAVVLGTTAYKRFSAWLPLKRTPVGVNFGEPIEVTPGPDERAARVEAHERLRQSYLDLYVELEPLIRPSGRSSLVTPGLADPDPQRARENPAPQGPA